MSFRTSGTLIRYYVCFIDIRGAEALLGCPTGNVNRVADHSAKDAMPRRPHWRHLLPGVGRGVVHFHFAKKPWILAAKNVEPVIHDSGGDPRPAGRHRPED